MREARVFESHKCTTAIHNALLDMVMPKVSGNAWKLLCLVIRQTDGWNREEIGLSYRDLLLGMGVGSRATIANALDELEPLNLLKVSVKGRWEESAYCLNLDAVVLWIPVDFANLPVTKTVTEKPVTEIVPVTENVTAPVTENEPGSVTENELINRKESKSEPIHETKKERESSERKAARKPDALYEIFAEKFLQTNPIPYLSKTADFVQLTALRKKSLAANWELTESRFALAVEHYFASELGQFTLADLSVRFSAFYKSPLDRFGQPIKNGSNGNGNTYESAGERNSRYIRETLEQCFGAGGNDSPASAVDSEITICLQPTGD